MTSEVELSSLRSRLVWNHFDVNTGITVHNCMAFGLSGMWYWSQMDVALKLSGYGIATKRMWHQG